MHFHRSLSSVANAKWWGITKKAQMCFLPFWCCGLISAIPSLLVCILGIWGLWLFRFQCFSQLLGAFKICFMHTTTTGGKKKLITERNPLFSLIARNKKYKRAFPIRLRQCSLLMSGNVLNSYPRGVSYTMKHIHAWSCVTSHSQLLPVTHNSWSKLNCQKIPARQRLLFSTILVIMMNNPVYAPTGTF